MTGGSVIKCSKCQKNPDSWTMSIWFVSLDLVNFSEYLYERREIWIFGKKIDNIVFVYFLLCFSLTSKTIFHLNKIEKCGKVPFFYLVHQWMENIFIYILLIAIITVWDGQSLEFLFVLMDVNIHRVQLFFFLYRTRSSLSETPNCDKWRD